MSYRMVLTALLLGVAVSASWASDVAGVTYFGGQPQIWLRVNTFDSATEQFTDDASYNSSAISGHAYYFGADSPSGTQNDWYAEYSLDQATLGPALTGTWHYYGRTLQATVGDPYAGSNAFSDSNWLLVKNDPLDGSGATWYTTALAGRNNDDKIYNDFYPWMCTSTPNGGTTTQNHWINQGEWGWMGESYFNSTPGVGQDIYDIAKQFSVDASGKIVYRLYEREAGTANVHTDLMVWSKADMTKFSPLLPYITGATQPELDYMYNNLLLNPKTLLADTNQDGQVNGDDFVALAVNYTGTGGSGKTWASGDFDYDGDVDGDDFVTLAVNYTGTIHAVPEPVSLVLLGLGGLLAMRRRS